MDDEERCPIPECDQSFDHSGAHEDTEGFRWAQSPSEANEDRADERAKGELA